MTNSTWIKKLLLSLTCCLVLLACSPPVSAPQPSPTPAPLDLIKALNSAINRGDVDAALDLFSDERLVYNVLREHATDKESLRYYLDWWATGGNPANTYRDCQSEGERVTCTWDYYDGACTEAFGFDVIHYEIHFSFQDGKIREMFGGITSDEETAVNAAVAEVFAWVAENHPEKGRELDSASTGSERSGRKAGELLLEICSEYLEAMGE